MKNKGLIHIPGGTEWDSERSHYATQDNTHFKTNELLIYGIFHEKFLDCS